MTWYRAGTVTVTNGSPAVTGAGTDFVANAQIGHAFLGPDGRVYEVAGVVSATQLTLAAAYLGGTGGGQGYAIMPTSSFARDLALGAAELLNTFAVVRDGIGQGLVGSGSEATPAIRFSDDRDTGLRRVDANLLALVAGGADRFRAGQQALYALAPFAAPASGAPALHGFRNDPSTTALRLSSNFPGGSNIDINTGVNGVSNGGLDIRVDDVSRMVIDAAGNLLVGIPTGSQHSLVKALPQGGLVAFISGGGGGSVLFYSVSSNLFSGTGCALAVGRNDSTGRSINAGGTINAGGADYAEYMAKADGCGTIAPGDVCGVDIDGHLTRTWADAVSFVVKSTDPAYVGGDVWGRAAGPAPVAPDPEPAAPITPPAEPASDEEADLAAWRAALAAHPAALTAHAAAHAAWVEARDLYATAKAAWDADLEAARQKVDRIAFCGQVPVDVVGSFSVGDYVIAAAAGAGIKAVAVPPGQITFDQYRRRLGKVWAVRDGRAWVDVQHG